METLKNYVASSYHKIDLPAKISINTKYDLMTALETVKILFFY
jgi:hypothetical protein